MSPRSISPLRLRRRPEAPSQPKRMSHARSPQESVPPAVPPPAVPHKDGRQAQESRWTPSAEPVRQHGHESQKQWDVFLMVFQNSGKQTPRPACRDVACRPATVCQAGDTERNAAAWKPCLDGRRTPSAGRRPDRCRDSNFVPNAFRTRDRSPVSRCLPRPKRRSLRVLRMREGAVAPEGNSSSSPGRSQNGCDALVAGLHPE